jgi:hypothetical protein
LAVSTRHATWYAERVSRRSFVQRFVYTLLVLFFGPDVLLRLDVEETERAIDRIADGQGELSVPMLFLHNGALWYRNDRGEDVEVAHAELHDPTVVALSPELLSRISGRWLEAELRGIGQS